MKTSELTQTTANEFLKDKKTIDPFGGNCAKAYDLMIEAGCDMPDELSGEQFTDIVQDEEGNLFAYYSEGQGSSILEYVQIKKV